MTRTSSPQGGRRINKWVAGFSSLAGLLIVALSSGCSTVSQEKLRLLADNAPCPVVVPKGEEMAVADLAAREERGTFVVRGDGVSMEPFYASGTAVVVRVCGYDRLRRGMAAVYRNHRGVAVAHMLLEKTAEGWTATGLNNEGLDYDRVTEANLVGVITQAYSSHALRIPPQISQRIAFNRQVYRALRSASVQMGFANSEVSETPSSHTPRRLFSNETLD